MSVKLQEFVTVKSAVEWEASTDKPEYCLRLVGIGYSVNGAECCDAAILYLENAFCDLLNEMGRPPLTKVKTSHCFDFIRQITSKVSEADKTHDISESKIHNLHATCRGFRAVIEDTSAGPNEESFYEIIVNVNEGNK